MFRQRCIAPKSSIAILGIFTVTWLPVPRFSSVHKHKIFTLEPQTFNPKPSFAGVLGQNDQADILFRRAIEHCSHDATIIGAYASFVAEVLHDNDSAEVHP